MTIVLPPVRRGRGFPLGSPATLRVLTRAPTPTGNSRAAASHQSTAQSGPSESRTSSGAPLSPKAGGATESQMLIVRSATAVVRPRDRSKLMTGGAPGARNGAWGRAAVGDFAQSGEEGRREE